MHVEFPVFGKRVRSNAALVRATSSLHFGSGMVQSQAMLIGPLLNVAGILIGGIVGLLRRKSLSVAQESWFKIAIGAFTVFYGLRLTWSSLNGSFGHVMKQLLITVLALMLGKITGRLLHFQKASNRLGQKAKEIIAAASATERPPTSDGFKTCALLYCAAPLGILGSISDGLSGYFYPLAVKGIIDGLATLGFIRMFGWSVLVAALPVLAFQGTISLGCAQLARNFSQYQALALSINSVVGLLVFAVALVILQLKKIELADYLPSVFFAPLLTYFFG
jgi:uncharacterized membrane protein YqgA involved in biofilm formation